MKPNQFLALLITLIIISCKENTPTINQVTLPKFDPELGITQSQSDSIYEAFYLNIKKNTINKSLPKTTVYDKDWNAITLNDYLQKSTILAYSGVHCGFGYEFICEQFPRVKDSLELMTNKSIYAIQLISYTNEDSLQQESIQRRFSDTEGIYQHTFLIPQRTAFKQNAYGSTFRYYLKNEIITNISFGLNLNSDTILANEITSYHL